VTTPPARGRADETPWLRLAAPDPVELRDPLAELLGMVETGDPLVFTFADVAKAAGHACPAVAGAYRAVQLALDRLYPDDLPVRGDVRVVVGGEPADSGLGPMVSVVRHLTGAADETGFAGFDGYGGREGLLSFGRVDGPGAGRSFEFVRTDADRRVRVSFDPSALDAAPPDGDDSASSLLPKLVSGAASAAERERFTSGGTAESRRSSRPNRVRTGRSPSRRSDRRTVAPPRLPTSETARRALDRLGRVHLFGSVATNSSADRRSTS
jgi:hypothetical protein